LRAKSSVAIPSRGIKKKPKKNKKTNLAVQLEGFEAHDSLFPDSRLGMKIDYFPGLLPTPGDPTLLKPRG